MYALNILLATIELQTHLCFIPRIPLDATNFKKEKNSTSTFAFKKDTGYFDVKLILDFRGCKDSILKKNSVYIKAPIALFQPENVLFCNPINFPNTPVKNKFVDISKSGKITDNIDVDWTFDDGQNQVSVCRFFKSDT